MTKVITVGVFDYFHIGHLNLFKSAKTEGDYLIVAVQDSSDIKKTKPNANIFYNTAQRVELVSSLSIVDEVIIYHDVDTIIPRMNFDVFAVGEDQVHAGFERAIKWCEDNGKKVVRMHRTPGICSSQIKDNLLNLK